MLVSVVDTFYPLVLKPLFERPLFTIPTEWTNSKTSIGNIRWGSRLSNLHEHAIAVHLPVHASWLNQIELYFSILQRKVLTSRDFVSADDMTQRILAFQEWFTAQAKLFNWRFSAEDLQNRMRLLN